MDTLTLDTNAWRDWAWCEGITVEKRYNDALDKKRDMRREFARLRLLQSKKICEIGNPSQVFLDFKRTEWNLPQKLQEFIDKNSDSIIPCVFSFPLCYPIVFGSREDYEKLFTLIFPDSQEKDKKYLSNRVDTMLLYANILDKRDVFITSDKAILRHKNELRFDWKTKVATLANYLEHHLKNS